MNMEKLDQALDQIGYQAALEWAPFRAASLQGVIVNIVAQPSVNMREADREAVQLLKKSAATILEAIPKLSRSMREIIEGPARTEATGQEALAELSAVLLRLMPGIQYGEEVTEGEKRKPGKQPATKERRVIEACAEIYILAENRRPPYGSDDYGSPTGPFTKGVAAVFEALELSCKSCAAQCRKVCREISPEEIEAIRSHGVLHRHLRDRTQ